MSNYSRRALRAFWNVLLASSLCSPTLVLAGGSPRRISGPHEGNCYTPSLSPDGTKVAYEVNYFERRVIELYVYDLATGKEQAVVASKGGSAIMSSMGVQKGRQVTYELAWAPGRSRNFVFSSSGGDENYDLYLSSGGLLASDPAADGMAAWSRDGQYLAFTSARTGEGDLYLVDVNNTDAKPAPLTRYNDSTEWYPTWSPEGRKLLFVRHFAKGGDNLFVLNDALRPKDTVVQLTNWDSIQTKPSWSPDGKQIAFYSNHRAKERYDLYVMAPEAGAAPRLIMENVLPNDRLGPAWTPDSKALVVVKDDPERFNPIRMISVTDPTKVKILATGTQNNGDIQVLALPNGTTQMAFTAQGRIGDSIKSFKKVYVFPLDAADLTF